MPKTVDKVKQTTIQSKLPQIKNVEQKTQMFNFDGAWLPSIDAALIGAKNFRELINMRYTEGGIEGINGYFDFNSTAISTYTNVNSGIHFRTNRTDDSYILVHASDSSGNGRIFYSTSAVGIAEGTGSFGATALHSDVSADLVGRFSEGPSGAIAYCNQEESLIWEGTEADIMTLFTLANVDPDNAGAYPIDETDECIDRIVANYITMDTSARSDILILSTAPLQGIKLYIDPSNPNTNVANTDAIVVKYWNGSSMAAVANLVDGTTKLSVTGTLDFDSTVGSAITKHYHERYAYAYTVGMTASAGTSSARVYQVTVDKPMQAPTNIWDGIYRQPIQAQRYSNADTSYEDFTVHVREASTVELPVGLFLGQITLNDHFILMFDEPMAAIKFTMLGSLVNILNAQFAAAGGVKYWDGDSWANLSFTDNTLDPAADSSCSKTGLIHWSPPSDEEQQELFGTLGYTYKFTTDGTFTGAADDNEVTADLITGIPAQQDLQVYKFASQYKNKLMMCGYVEGNEGNRIDFCVDNNPHMWNGADSSDNGYQSIHVGSVEEITAATQLYNRFGSNIFSLFVILKNNEVWLMLGDTPIDYKLYPISFRIGCPAPGTLCTASVGLEGGESTERNVAMWISHQGPVMFDGATISSIKGIEKYFDPNDSDSINFDYFKDSQGWFDSTYSEWNILLPGKTSTTLDLWFVYDLKKQKWFQKNTNTGQDIVCGIQCVATNGDQYTYGGAHDGRLYELETGASWDGAPITYEVTTGDFAPTGDPWDVSLIRRLKLVTKKLTETGASVKLYYQSDTNASSGVSVTWVDVTALLADSGTAGLAFTDATALITDSGTAGVSFVSAPAELLDMSIGQGSNRLVRMTKDMNEIAWMHSFTFEFTSSQSAKGFIPVMWGIQYSKIRLDQ